jgi:hypothetical protein
MKKYKPRRQPAPPRWLPPAYEIDEDGNQLRDGDGNLIEIFDEVAVRLTVTGDRVVAITEKERDAAILEMIRRGYLYKEIARNLGTSAVKLRPLIENLGFEVIPRRQEGGGFPREATEIRKRVA